MNMFVSLSGKNLDRSVLHREFSSCIVSGSRWHTMLPLETLCIEYLIPMQTVFQHQTADCGLIVVVIKRCTRNTIHQVFLRIIAFPFVGLSWTFSVSLLKSFSANVCTVLFTTTRHATWWRVIVPYIVSLFLKRSSWYVVALTTWENYYWFLVIYVH